MTYKIIIAGGRDFKATCRDLYWIDGLISNHYDVKEMVGDLEFVTGCAKGADQIPFIYHYWHGVPLKQFPADWDRWGKSAGYIRNREMAKYADGLIAFWDGKSKGTKHMIDLAEEYKLKIRVSRY